jgi:UDP-N-acetylglucosamine 2-epimerase
MNLLLSYGTRPEYIKIKPVLHELKKRGISYQVVYTGQHPDLVETDLANIRLPKIGDDDKKNRLDSIVTHILEARFIYDRITHVLVQGDTTSAFAIALGAFHRQIPVFHLEAGLRTYARHPYPEELNRKAISNLADIHFAPTENNKINLIREGIDPRKIFVVGNTVLDNLITLTPSYGEKVLVTLHRRENLPILAEYFTQLNNIAGLFQSTNFLFPMHPNPKIQALRSLLTSENIHVVPPVPYHNFIIDLAQCKFIISDSGGIQEEASFLKKRIIVCREFTERPEILNDFGFLCKRPRDLPLFFTAMKDNFKIDLPSPYGDGRAAEKVVNIIQQIADEKK